MEIFVNSLYVNKKNDITGSGVIDLWFITNYYMNMNWSMGFLGCQWLEWEKVLCGKQLTMAEQTGVVGGKRGTVKV